LQAVPLKETLRSGSSTKRRLGSGGNGPSTGSKGKPQLRLGQSSEEGAAFTNSRRLERQAKEIEEMNREAAEEQAAKAAQDEKRARRRQRRQMSAERRRIWKARLAALAVIAAALMVAGGVVAAFMARASYIRSLENHGSGNDDLLAYVPGNSACIVGYDVGGMAPVTDAYKWDVNTRLENAINVNFGRDNFLNNTPTTLNIGPGTLFDRMICAVTLDPFESVTLIGRSAKAFNQFTVKDIAGNPRARRHANLTYWQVDAKPFTALFMPSDQIIVLTNAPDAVVQQMVASQGTQVSLPAEGLKQVEAVRSQGLWIVAPMKGRVAAALHDRMGTVKVPPVAPWQGLNNLIDQAGWFRVWLEPKPDRICVGVNMAGETEAEQLLRAAGAFLASDTSNVANRLANVNVLPRAYQPQVKEFLKKFELQRDGTFVWASAAMSDFGRGPLQVSLDALRKAVGPDVF
jgi:hypothetical protein